MRRVFDQGLVRDSWWRPAHDLPVFATVLYWSTRCGAKPHRSGRMTDRRPPGLVALGACPLCQASESKELFVLTDRLHEVPGEFSYRRCGACRSVFQDPQVRTEDIPKLYPSTYYTHEEPSLGHLEERDGARGRLRTRVVETVKGTAGPGWSLGTLLAKVRGLRERAFFGLPDEMLPRPPLGERALDVGCGAGALMRSLSWAGWSVEGVDLDPRAAEAAREASGGSVHVGAFDEVDLPREAFQLIALFHSFEHFPDPLRVLARARELLSPKGRVVLVYPNASSAGTRLFGPDWFAWEAPRHLLLPPAAAVRRAASKVGLRVTKARTRTTGADLIYAYSRAYRSGRSVDQVRAGFSDRLLKNVVSMIESTGWHLGEELVVTLTREGGGGSR